jgi:hypothetical protein
MLLRAPAIRRAPPVRRGARRLRGAGPPGSQSAGGVRVGSRGRPLAWIDDADDVRLPGGDVHLRESEAAEQERDRRGEVGGEGDRGEQHVRGQVREDHRAQEAQPSRDGTCIRHTLRRLERAAGSRLDVAPPQILHRVIHKKPPREARAREPCLDEDRDAERASCGAHCAQLRKNPINS